MNPQTTNWLGMGIAAGLMALASLTSSKPAAGAEGRDRIIIVGSSTVYPFSSIVAEHFAKSGPFPTPSVRFSSTTDGFKQLCAGNGMETPDIGNASRRMTAGERDACEANGVRRLAEVRVGYDSLVLANHAGTLRFDITLEQLWRATARMVPVNGSLILNPYSNWHQIAPALPDAPIQMFGPGPDHGTRDTFAELVMEPGCATAMRTAGLLAHDRRIVCSAVRTDGRWIDVNELELILGKLTRNHTAIGVLTYSYLEQFSNRIHSLSVEGISPSRSTIASANYPLSRPLYMYVKTEHLGIVTGLADYAAEFLSSCAAGANGYLSAEGLVPMPIPELRSQRAVVAQLQH